MAIQLTQKELRELELQQVQQLLGWDEGLSAQDVATQLGWTRFKARTRLNQLVKRGDALVEFDKDDGRINRYFLPSGDSYMDSDQNEPPTTTTPEQLEAQFDVVSYVVSKWRNMLTDEER